MVSKALDLLQSAKRKGISIALDKGELQLRFARGIKVDAELLQQIKDNKNIITDFLQNNNWKSKKVDAYENELSPFDRDEIKHVPLSFSQERLWFIDQLSGSIQYHMPVILTLKGELDTDPIDCALRGIVDRHHVLRTVIYQSEGRGYQNIIDPKGWRLNVVTDDFYRKKDEETLKLYIEQLVNQPFDLSKDYMLRADLIRLDEQEHVLVVTMHHIAADGWSMSILVKELVELYESHVQERKPQLTPLLLQYADYAVWQRKFLAGETLNKKLAYWKDKLADVTPLQLPTDFVRPMVLTTKGATVNFFIEKDLSARVHELSQEQGATVFMTLLSAVNVLLYRYSGQEDISVGTPTANRTQQELEGLIGFFVNTLTLRSNINSDISFIDLLQQVKQSTLEAYEHQDVPFDKVVEAVVKERDMSRSLLFQVMLIVQNTPKAAPVQSGKLQVSSGDLSYTTAKFEITFLFNDTPDGLQGVVEYSTDLYKRETIVKMVDHFKELLRSIVKSPQQKIDLLGMLSKEEEHHLLVECNDTQVNYPREKTVIDLFEEQVKATPDAIAVVFENRQLTYQQLNEKANQLAHHLRAKGVKEEMLVPICIERGLDLMIGLLGILKSGAAFIPIDPEYPADRISYMLQDSGGSLIISSKSSRIKLNTTHEFNVIEIDADNAAINTHSIENLSASLRVHHLAYVIYTSGSTGKPKGVMIEHSSLTNLLLSITNHVDFSATSGMLSVTTYSFDICYLEFFTPLINGGKLIIVSRDVAIDGYKLSQQLALHVPTHMQGTPSTWQLLLEAGWDNKEQIKILIGGEAVKESLKDALTKIGEVFNLYGPTETTIWSAIKKLSLTEKVLIGKPLANTTFYIVNNSFQLAAVGTVGEIYIGGAGLARGYLHLHELTAEKFIDNPFSKANGERLYKTGDLGRWLPGGNIEYISRIDDQVKIRGYRIELGEIEGVIIQSKLANQAVAIVKEDAQRSKYLVAYVVTQDVFVQEDLVSYLRSKLPEYMVPSLFVKLERLPLTPNGKIDKKALPDPDINELLSHQYVEPRNDVEQQIAGIWQRFLKVEKVGIHDNFFALGGHSIMAMQIISAIRQQLKVELSIKDLFIHPSIIELSAHFQQQGHGLLLPPIHKQSYPPYIPLSFSQERLWFIDQLEGSLQYNLPTVLRIRGPLVRKAFAKALKRIIERHEVLRTIFLKTDGHPYQHIKDSAGWDLNFVDGLLYKSNPVALQEYINTIIRQPFNLSKDFMFRAELIQLEDNEHVLAVVMHHIASDAWSLPIIIDEVSRLYSAYVEGKTDELKPMHLQYADYALWQRSYLTPQVLDEKVNYWKRKLEGIEALKLPTDYTRPLFQNNEGGSAGFTVNKILLEELHELGHKQGSTIFMTLLAAFKVLLFRYSGQTDISVGTSIANRTQQELESMVGFFVNTLAFRDHVSGDTTFEEFLQRVKVTTLEAYEHHEVPFEKVVEAVVKDRNAGTSPLFQVMLVLGNTPNVPGLKISDLTLASESYEHTISKFDLTFFISEGSSGLHGMVQYRTDLFKAATIERMMSHFVNLLGSIVKDPRQQVGALSMLSSREEQQLLSGFNVSKAVYPQQKTIVDLFEEQALKTPDATAIVYEEETLTYGQLNTKANHLAHYLKQKGVKEDVLVPICIDRSTQLIIGILGILKSGGAYVPIDTDFPGDRISYMLQDSGSSMVLSDQNSRSKIEMADADANIIDIEDIAIQLQPGLNPQRSLRATHLAYVIYTSGSTGKPKGVMIEHRSLVDYVYGLKEKIQVDQSRSYALVSSIATDLGNTVIYSSLVFGGALHLFSKEAVSNIDYLHNYFSNHTIDCLKIVPSHWKALRLDGQLLLPSKLLVFGGEALHKEVYEEIKMSGTLCKVVNHYGPTETTIGKLLHITDINVTYNSTIPIGQPFSNTAVYVLSKEMQLVPVGIPGQLYIAGHGVARGYLNNIELTKEKFIENTFSNDEDKRLMYATGDMVKYVADGQIEFIGRIDNQVKIRGYRIELGEIESTLQQCDLVSHAAVLTKEDRQGNNRLIAYIVANGWYNREGITKYLKEHLPEYMVPALLVEMEMLPLTANGKIDRKGLPDPDATEILSNQYVGPRNEVEQKLATIWQNILEVEQVGVHDDFFELGGHSLLAVRLISAIRKELSVEMPISDIFDYTTVAQLAEQLTAQSGTIILPSIEVVQPRPGRIPLSFSQERLWFIHQLEGSIQYHVPAVLNLKGSINVEALEFAIKNIVNRHEVLRTVILQNEGEPYQYIKEKDLWQLTVIDGSAYKEDWHGLHQYIQQLINSPFDLSKDDMIRGHLVTLDVNNSVLLVNLHHIASDGWSRGILVKELAELYKAYAEGASASLAPLPLQYADYAIWQRNYLHGDVLEKKINYWQEQLHGVEPLQLPTDYARPAVQSTKGASVGFKIEKELTEQLQLLSHQHNTTLFMTLLAVFKVLLYRYTGQQDICVGSGVAGRQQQEVEGLIGFFINMLALRSHVDGNASFVETLLQVRTTTLQAYSHQEVPFEKIVDAIVTERDLSRNPVFQVAFTLQNTPDMPRLQLGDVQLSPEGSEQKTSKFDLTFNLVESDAGLQVVAEYCADLFSESTISRMMLHYGRLIQSVVKEPLRKVGEFDMLSDVEKHQLHEFNNTKTDYDRGRTIINLIEDQVIKSPDNVAIAFGDQKLTYRQLNEQSNRLAHYLLESGLNKEDLVPVCMERSIEMIISLLGIIKAGGAYVPIDPKYPPDRITFMLEDSGASMAICNSDTKALLKVSERMQVIQIECDEIKVKPTTSLHTVVDPNHLAYVIYTSGSTGKPKGVLIEHRGVANLVNWHVNEYGVNDSSRATCMAGVGFDAFGWEIWPYLSVGASVYIVPENDRIQPGALTKFFINKNISHSFISTALVKDFLEISGDKIGSLRYLLTGGEKLSGLDIEGINYKLVNNYGPTENTVVSTFYPLTQNIKEIAPPIGKPIANSSIYIVDIDKNLVPVGITGEIWVGGASLARGYLNRSELTTEKFVKNPFGAGGSPLLYKTGDLGRWSSEGNIEYLGRLDNQIKVRGYRIEPGEIENLILENGTVNQVVVVAKEDAEGNNQLVCYVVPSDGFDRDAVVSDLKRRVPAYMVPALWVEMESLPLTANGKINVKALPTPDAKDYLANMYVAPRNELDEKLAKIWQDLLHVEQVGIDDNFFDLGGHSLLAMRIVAHIESTFMISIPIVVLFKLTTIRELSQYLETQLLINSAEKNATTYELLDV